MAMFGMIEVLMAVLAGGGGNDLLDYMPTKAYWQSKGVAVTAQAMQDELTPVSKEAIAALIKDLTGNDEAKRTAAAGRLAGVGISIMPQLEKAAAAAQGDPEKAGAIQQLIGRLYTARQAGAVRRLMAIRTLGQLKCRPALGTLKGLLKSKALFEAEYAAAAIAAIEGKAWKRPGAGAKTLAGDVWRLPANCGIVAQMTMPPGAPVDIAKLIKNVGQLPNGMTAEQIMAQGTKMLVMAAEVVGNIRFDSVTMGVAGDVGNRSGFAVFVGRGKYDSKTIAALIGEQGRRTKTETINGIDVVMPDNEVALIIPSDDMFVMCTGPNRQALPLGEVTSAIKSGKGGLTPARKLGKLIKTVDTSQPLWAAATITDAYQVAGPMISAFKTITLVGKPAKGGQLFTVTGKGTDADAVGAAVKEFTGHIAKGIGEVERQVQRGGPQSQLLKPILEFMKSMKAESNGTSATVTATLKGSATGAMLVMPMLMFTARASHDIKEMEGPPEAVPQDAPQPAPDRN